MIRSHNWDLVSSSVVPAPAKRPRDLHC